MFGKLLADSGGADQIVDTLVSKSSRSTLPGRWPLSARSSACRCSSRSASCCCSRWSSSWRRLERAADDARHPHAGRALGHAWPGATAPRTADCRATLKADLGVTLALGVIVAIPTVIIAGPLFGSRSPAGPGGAPRCSVHPADRRQARELEDGSPGPPRQAGRGESPPEPADRVGRRQAGLHHHQRRTSAFPSRRRNGPASGHPDARQGRLRRRGGIRQPTVDQLAASAMDFGRHAPGRPARSPSWSAMFTLGRPGRVAKGRGSPPRWRSRFRPSRASC